MNTKILTPVIAFILSGTLAFAQTTPPQDKVQTTTSKTEIQKDLVYYSCAVHSDVRMQTPGNCPTCGAALEKKRMQTTVTKTEKKETIATYTCAAHPDVRATKPGVCPKCGSALVEKK